MHINGLARTKDDIVEDAVKDLFQAQDFQDVLVRANKVNFKFLYIKFFNLNLSVG